MKIHEIIHEAPMMVPQALYPGDFKRSAMRDLKRATTNPNDLKEESHHGDFRIMSQRGMDTQLFVFVKDLAVGVMELSSTNFDQIIGTKSWQVWNVFILPEHRNRRLGLALYYFILHDRKQAFASGAAMTPASRRVYTSLSKDPTIDVYALVPPVGDRGVPKRRGDLTRMEMRIGQDGVTTGDAKLDAGAIFVAIAK